jgi:hypothetical protein
MKEVIRIPKSSIKNSESLNAQPQVNALYIEARYRRPTDT